MQVYRIAITFSLFLLLMTVIGCDGSGPTDPNEMVLYTISTGKIISLDPGNISDRPSGRVACQVFECLYQYHYLKRPYEVIPMLAESMPEVSDDGLTYTIKIKKGVYFADDKCFEGGKGRELKAQDFVFAWKRIANIKYMSRNWWVFDGKIIGLDEFREYTKTCKSREDVDYSRGVDGLYASDDHTLVMKLKKPWPQIIYLLAFSPTSPMAKEAVDLYGRDIVSNPVGTGPYKLTKWHRGSYIEMERNPNFREEYYPSQGEEGDVESGMLADADVRLPIVDRIVWTIMLESQPAWLQFLRGKLDAMGIPKDSYGQAVSTSRGLTPEMKQRNMHLKKYRTADTFWIGFNMEDPILGKNKPLREAISYAIDRKGYIELFWNDRDEVAYGFIPPLMKAYDPEVIKVGKSYDPERAKELVKEAERVYGGKLPTLKLSTGGTSTFHRQLGQFRQREFEDVGLDVEVEYMDWPTYIGKVHSKSVQLFSLGWVADYPDVENFLQLFYGKNISPGTNNFNYVSSEFDRLYEQLVVMQDGPERVELYREAERLVIEDCPAAFINHPVAYVMHHDWVENYKPHVFQYGLAKYRRIDMDKRKGYKKLLKSIK